MPIAGRFTFTEKKYKNKKKTNEATTEVVKLASVTLRKRVTQSKEEHKKKEILYGS